MAPKICESPSVTVYWPLWGFTSLKLICTIIILSFPPLVSKPPLYLLIFSLHFISLPSQILGGLTSFCPSTLNCALSFGETKRRLPRTDLSSRSFSHFTLLSWNVKFLFPIEVESLNEHSNLSQDVLYDNVWFLIIVFFIYFWLKSTVF